MIKKIIKLFGAIVFVFLVLTLYLRYNTDYFQMQEKINGVYFNERFGYEIICNDPWYVWPYYSREMAVIRQTGDISIKELEKSNKELGLQLQSFKQKWVAGNSEIIFLTNSSQRELNQFIEWGGQIKVTDLPKGHWIQIFPIDIDPDLEKESLKEKGSLRIEVKPITLQSGLKAQQVDTRSLTGGTLSVLVSYDFDAKLDSGKSAESLNFITDAEFGSDSEKAFYRVVNSLSFSK